MNILDELILVRAAEEITPTTTTLADRRRLEGEAATDPEPPCGNEYRGVRCERGADHDGPCVALLIFPPPR